MSAGREKRPMGAVLRNFARFSGVSSRMKVLRSGVSPATGLMALTRMPSGASSTAIDLVAVTIQPLDALYQLSRGRGLTAAVEAMVRMTPDLAALKRGTTWRAVRYTDLTLTASTRSKSASEIS